MTLPKIQNIFSSYILFRTVRNVALFMQFYAHQIIRKKTLPLTLHMPQSVSFICPSESNKTLSNFRSLYTMPEMYILFHYDYKTKSDFRCWCSFMGCPHSARHIMPTIYLKGKTIERITFSEIYCSHSTIILSSREGHWF